MRRLTAALAVCGALALARLPAQPTGHFPGYPEIFDNPAIDVSRSYLRRATIRVPVGLLGLLHPERNPALYMTDRDSFETSFDGMAAIAQLSSPYHYLFEVPTSPDSVELSFDKSGATLTDGEGEPTVHSFVEEPVAPFYSLYRTAPLLQLTQRRAFLQLTHALHAGGSAVHVAPNRALGKLLAGQERDGEALALELAAAGGAGAEERITAYVIAPGSGGIDAIVAAARLGLHYTAALATFASRIEVSTADQQTKTAVDGRFLYPGSGYSVGARLDAGTLLTAGSWYGGIGVVSLAAADFTAGGLRTGDVPEHELTLGPGITPSVQLGSDGGGVVAVHAAARLRAQPSGRVSVLFRPQPLALQLSYRMSERPEASWSLHAPVGRGRLVFTITSRYSPFDAEPIYGAALSWDRNPSQPNWRPELGTGGAR